MSLCDSIEVTHCEESHLVLVFVTSRWWFIGWCPHLLRPVAVMVAWICSVVSDSGNNVFKHRKWCVFESHSQFMKNQCFGIVGLFGRYHKDSVLGEWGNPERRFFIEWDLVQKDDSPALTRWDLTKRLKVKDKYSSGHSTEKRNFYGRLPLKGDQN